MPPEDPKYTAVVKALVLAAGHTEQEWHEGSAGAWTEPFRQAARTAINGVPHAWVSVDA